MKQQPMVRIRLGCPVCKLALQKAKGKTKIICSNITCDYTIELREISEKFLRAYILGMEGNLL